MRGTLACGSLCRSEDRRYVTQKQVRWLADAADAELRGLLRSRYGFDGE
jgi:hypothetical protein